MSKESDDLKVLSDLDEKIKKDLEFYDRKKVLGEKELNLREHKVTRDYNELVKNTEELDRAKEMSFDRMTPESIDQLVKDNDEYMEAAKHAMNFINSEFKKTVPFFKRNLILIGGDTGDGKSTTSCNLLYGTITSKNPATGRGCRVLYLTNEEAPEDVVNRISALAKGWKYTNHDQFTDEQRKVFREMIPVWTKDGRLTVIGDVYNGIDGWTTTPEGISRIIDSVIEDHEAGKPTYDVIILDYYQNVTHSKLDPKLDEYSCQRRLAHILDRAKIRLPSVIVVMAQMKKLVDEEDSTPFNVRLKGSKLICDKATFICELIPERKLLRSKWKVWKSRFTEAVGDSIYTGYDRGKFVPYDAKFIANVAQLVNKNLERAKQQELGIPEEKEDADET